MAVFHRALVTGGAGFLGSHLCAALLDAGTEVVCVDNLCTGSMSNVESLRAREDFTFLDVDVAELDADDAAFDGLDLVMHLASPASPVDYQRLGVATLRAGAIGTDRALALALRSGARFLLASTSEVYGDPLQHPQTESYWGNVNPVGIRSVYDEAKRYGEALTMAYRRDLDANTAIARIFNTYGPRMRGADGRMIPNFVRQALAGEPLTVSGAGTQTRSICYVDDTVEGLLALAHSNRPGPMNIGNPTEMTVLEVARLVARLAGTDASITFIDAVEDDPQRRCPDISRAADELGWRPRVDAETGLRRTIAWFAEHSRGAGVRSELPIGV
ncbi:SDR family oxidoreductase [Skermania sp. ID1734]|uniref:UDP-glucuronic acid decarboxylase family protein n=1 Tax=Skermania sp. ID1734 TaxID=2597516 RepID=UPI00117D6F34|nr:UDP-glucuronic acid decarboxylase family protein [Skermania sp. ID1734]TSD99461.1 SDR family oxidoreductase [Skermania sp. ID1734]